MKKGDKIYWISTSEHSTSIRVFMGEVIDIDDCFCDINCVPGKGWWPKTMNINEVYTSEQDAYIELWNRYIRATEKEIEALNERLETYKGLKEKCLIEKLAGI